MLLKAAIAVFVKVGLGSIQYIFMKDLLHTKSQIADGSTQEFDNRAWFLTFATFVAMFLCSLPVVPMEYRKYQSKQRDESGALVNMYSMRLFLYTFLPAGLDFAALVLTYRTNAYLLSSVMVLLKGSRAVFTAGMTSTVLKRKQTGYQWAGIIVTSLGVVAIAVESVVRNSMSDTQSQHSSGVICLAIILTLLAELMRAIRFVYEERLIKINRLSAQALVFFESSAGLFLATGGWLIAGITGRENIQDTLAMVSNSRNLQWLLISTVLIAGICNVAAAFITKYLSSVHNALCSEIRVVFVWIPQVIRRFISKANNTDNIPDHKLPGEPLDALCIVKLLGFALLISGAMIYNGNIKLPFKKLYPQDNINQKNLEAETPLSGDARV